MSDNVEPVVWELKDLRMARMNALNRAVDLCIAKEITFENIESQAEKFVDYIYDGVEAKEEKKPPTPLENRRILDKICGEYEKDCPDGFVVIYMTVVKKILEHFGKLPTREESIPKILEVIPISEVIVEGG